MIHFSIRMQQVVYSSVYDSTILYTEKASPET